MGADCFHVIVSETGDQGAEAGRRVMAGIESIRTVNPTWHSTANKEQRNKQKRKKKRDEQDQQDPRYKPGSNEDDDHPHIDEFA